MNCIIPGNNLKVLAKALQAISKIGDELYVQAAKERLSFATISPSKTVCARIHFVDTFFSSYEVDDAELKASKGSSIPCKVHLKLLLPLFRGNLEKKVDFFKLEFEAESAHMLLKMKYKCDDIVMVHKLRLMDSESLTVDVAADAGPNRFRAPSSFYTQLLSTFNHNDNEVTFEVGKAKTLVRNYSSGVLPGAKRLRTQISLNATEFLTYQIRDEVAINFSLKPFKTAVQFAEFFNLDVEFNFDLGGKPVSLVMRNPTFEVNFIVASLDPNKVEGTPSMASLPSNAHDVTMDDIEALQTENWDEDDFDNKIDSNKNDVVPPPPADSPPSDSPKTKRVKMVFSRCFSDTVHDPGGRVLAPNSDSE